MIMLTGRIPKLSNQVESILNKNGVIFDEYHYKEKGDTFTSKINTLKKLIEQNPNVTEIEMWEDRLNHADGFEEWGVNNGIDISNNSADGSNVIPNRLPILTRAQNPHWKSLLSSRYKSESVQ